MHATRADGVQVYLHSDGTWTEAGTSRSESDLTLHLYGVWLSDYDLDQRTVTLSRVEAAPAGDWRMGEVVRSPELSDPGGRFEVFVIEEHVWMSSTRERSYLTPGDIVKVVARLDDDGYFKAWHPDFCEDPVVCEGTLWGIYSGGRRGNTDSLMPRHWIYISLGDIIKPWLTQPRTWADAQGEWSDSRDSARTLG